MNIQILQLVQEAKSGDANAFSQLYSHYWKDLYAFAYYTLQNKEDAEDAVQDALICVWNSIGKVKSIEKFKSYLFTCVSNSCKQTFKKRKNNLNIDDFSSTLSSTDNTKAIELWELLKTLDPTERLILSLSLTSGYTSKEISKITLKNANTVRSTLSRTLEKLRAANSNEG